MLLDCGHEESPHKDFTTGYGIDKDGKKHCYDCCAKRDKEQMDKDGKTILYLSLEPRDKVSFRNHIDGDKVTNWPGSLSYPIRFVTRGKHNIARTRYDFWFYVDGKKWYGVQYGEDTQLAHCRRIKS